MKYCCNCGKPIPDDALFCENCEKHNVAETSTTELHTNSNSSATDDNPLINQLNSLVGNDKPIKLNWKLLFTDVTKPHTTEDAEEIFICGTRKTTPSVNEVSKDWPHPWLYSRVFLMFAIAFALLWICCCIFQNTNALPGLIIVGSFTVPLSTLILFFELNAWRDVSLYEVSKMFLVGGCASLVATLFLFTFFGVHELDFYGAFMTSCIEEAGKVVIVYYFLKIILY